MLSKFDDLFQGHASLRAGQTRITIRTKSTLKPIIKMLSYLLKYFTKSNNAVRNRLRKIKIKLANYKIDIISSY